MPFTTDKDNLTQEEEEVTQGLVALVGAIENELEIGVALVTHKPTGEEHQILSIQVPDPNGQGYRTYPIARMLTRRLIVEYEPPTGSIRVDGRQ